MPGEKYAMEGSGQDLALLFRRAARLMARTEQGGPQGRHGYHAQRHVLSLLLEKGPLPQSELLEILDVRSSSLSEILSKLERQGLVTRERNENDRRSFIVAATGLARQILSEREPVNDADRMFACLTTEEQDHLRGILQKLISSAQNAPQCGKPAFGRNGGRGGGRGKFGKGRGKGGRRG